MHTLICNLCHQNMDTADSCRRWKPDAKAEPLIYRGPGRCSDCHVVTGGTHHPHCDFFICLDCGGHAKWCDCGDNAGSADE